MRKVFLTFGCGDPSFIAARERIKREAKATQQFDDVLGYGWEDVTNEEVLASPLRKYGRGAGYWLWKPAIIYSALSNLSDGDVLVYCDAGDVLFKSRGQWTKFFRMLEDCDVICRRISASHIQFTRKELLEKFGTEHGIRGRLDFQFEINAAFIKKTPFTVDLMRKWLDFMIANPDVIRDVDGEVEANSQLPTFVENRHDQSVFSLLLMEHFSRNDSARKIKTVWEFHLGWIIWGYPCIEVARLRGDANLRFGFSKWIVRLCYRLLWRMQLFLERHGLCLFWEKGGYYGA